MNRKPDAAGRPADEPAGPAPALELGGEGGDFYEDWHRYFDLYNFSPVPYIWLSRSGVVEEINQAGCRLLGIPHGMLINRPMIVRFDRPSRTEFLEHMRRCRSSDEVIESDLTLIGAGQTLIHTRAYSKRSHLAHRSIFWMVLINLTEHRQLDDARRQAEFERAKAENDERLGRLTTEATHRFLNVLSHELRTPLTPALFAASRLLEDDVPERIRKLASVIKRNILGEARLIDDLLDVSRIERGALGMTFAPIDLHEIIGQAVEATQPQLASKPIVLSVSLNAAQHFVTGDGGRLRQVFSNLLTNAIKFTDGGRIDVRTTNSESGSVRVSVSDTGVGLSEEDLPGLFKSFEQHRGQSSRGGLGLGLAICRGVIEGHRGGIWAHSRGLGEGSTFEVELATIPEALRAAPSPVPVRHPEHNARMRILVVEDDDETAAMLKDMLDYEGHQLNVVHTLREARAQAGETWDIVISDLGLPDGTGYDVARRFMKAVPRPRLIALSGFGNETDIAASSDAGFERHLVKPIDLDQLRSALNP